MTRRRLDAWKEIARYLGRDVTTVRRWEKREGLPVHRHRHEKLGSVYAWADEIDTWSERRSVRAEPAPLPEPAPSAAVPLLAEHPQVSAADVEQPVPGRRGGAGPGPWKVGLGLAGVAALVAVLASSLAPGTRAGADRPGHIALTPPAGVIVESLVISPDGKQVAFAGKDSAGVRLWIRRLDSAAVEPIAGTEGATHPFWSPESDQVGFFAAGWLKRVGLATRTVHQIAVAPDGRGGTWNDRDDILFVADSGAPVSRVSVFGGDITAATSLAAGVKVGHAWPEFLPDGRHFLYTDYSADPQQYGIYVGDVDTRNSRRLLPVYSSAAYSRDGYLLFVRNSLMAQPFDVERLFHALVDDVDRDLGLLCVLLVLLRGALLRAALAIQHVRACGFVLAAAHQRELDLVLDLLDVDRAALGLALDQRRDDRFGQHADLLADTRAGRALAAVDGEERLGHRDRDLRRLEADHRTIATDDLVLRETRIRAAPDRATRFAHDQFPWWRGRRLGGGGAGNLHGAVS